MLTASRGKFSSSFPEQRFSPHTHWNAMVRLRIISLSARSWHTVCQSTPASADGDCQLSVQDRRSISMTSRFLESSTAVSPASIHHLDRGLMNCLSDASASMLMIRPADTAQGPATVSRLNASGQPSNRALKKTDEAPLSSRSSGSSNLAEICRRLPDFRLKVSVLLT